MKIDKHIQYIFVFSITLLANCSCTDDFESLNTANDLVTEDLVDVNLMLTLVQVRAIKESSLNGTGTIGNYSGISYSSSNSPFNESDAPELWNDTYQNFTNNLSEIIRLTKEDADLVNKTAIARIMKVWAFAKLTDTYGDVPYFESSLPPDEVVSTPKYDSQKSIYEDFFKELKEATASLDISKESFGSADLIYKGDVAKWRKFANSLRLRLALRVRYVDVEMAKTNMGDLQESDLILAREDDASLYTASDVQDNFNIFYNEVLKDRSNLVKKTAGAIINKMDEYNDPRVKIMADTAKASFPGDDPDLDYFGYRGHPVLGLVPIEYKLPWDQDTSSKISDLWYVQEIEVPVLRSSEVYFALSEAALVGLKDGNAQEYYKKGIEASMDWAKDFYENAKPQLPDLIGIIYPDWSSDDIDLLLSHKEITTTESDAFLNSPIAVLSGSMEEQLEQIMVQKNIALYPLEHENWAEWRRTGYPILQIGPDENDLKGVVPRRMPWPNIEQTINGANYEAAAAGLQGGDSKLSKVWWDANPTVPYPFVGDPLPTRDTPWVQN